jgi:urease accessory protein
MKTLQSIEAEQGWQAELDLRFVQANSQAGSRTIMKRSVHRGPLRVQRPFYPEDALAHIYILHPPGGVVGGDQLTINLEVSSAAQVLATTPGSGKFYLSSGHWAKLEQSLSVAAGASLEWLPQENILFAGARLHTRTTIDVDDDGTFIGWDVTCLGRPSTGERFDHGAFYSRLAFYHKQTLVLAEHQRVFDEQTLEAAAGLRGHALLATLLAFPCNDDHLEQVRAQLSAQGASAFIAATRMDGLLVVRALGNNSEGLKQRLISIWQVLRPLLLDRPALQPRIWAT